MGKFSGQVALITGASSGIGLELAKEFTREDAKIVLCARRLDRLVQIAEEMNAGEKRALAVQCDVTKDGDVERAVEKAVKEFGKIDIVVANAGFGVVGKIERLTVEDYRRQFETNVFGVLRTVKAATAELKKTHGRFAIIGSAAGYVAFAGSSPYAMSKFAVNALSQALYYELFPYGVSVTHICPGFIETEIRKVDNEGKLHLEAKDSIPKWLRMPADKAAHKIMCAIYRRRREAVITFHGKAGIFFQRHFPCLIAFAARTFGIKGRSNAQTSH